MNQYLKFFIMIVCFSISLLADILDDKLEKLINYENKNKSISLDYNPFVSEQKMLETKKENGLGISASESKELKLLSIINQKAFISGTWYGVGDMVDGSKIIKINHENIEIKKGSKITILAFEHVKNIINIKDSKK